MQGDPVFRPIDTAPNGSFYDSLWLTDEAGHMWCGWKDEYGVWYDCAEWAGENKDAVNMKEWGRDFKYGAPVGWVPSLPPSYVPLPDELDTAGEQLIDASDEVGIDAQGGAWVRTEEQGWKYLLITPRAHEPETMAKLKYLFEAGAISQAMVLEDVVLDDPNNYMFQLLAKLTSNNFGAKTYLRDSEHMGSHITDDGTLLKFWFRINAVVYRALKTIDGSDFNRPEPLPEEIHKALYSQLGQ